MRISDLLFTGMNIVDEARKLLEGFEATNGMTDSELKAYNMGIKNALNAVKVLVEQDNHIVFHLEDNCIIEEFDLDDLINIVEEKEGY